MKVDLLGDGPCPTTYLIDEKIDLEPRHKTKFFRNWYFQAPHDEYCLPGTVVNLYKLHRYLLPPRWDEVPEPWQWRYLCVHCGRRRSANHCDWATCTAPCWQCGSSHCDRTEKEQCNHPCPLAGKQGDYFTQKVGRERKDEFCDEWATMYQPEDWEAVIDGISRVRMLDLLGSTTERTPHVGSHAAELIHKEREDNLQLRERLRLSQDDDEQHEEEARQLREEARKLREDGNQWHEEKVRRLQEEVARLKEDLQTARIHQHSISQTAFPTKRSRSPSPNRWSKRYLRAGTIDFASRWLKGCLAEENEISDMADMY